MARWRIWILPTALAAIQLLLWPGLALARGDALDPARTAAVVALVLVVAAALGRRRRSPVVVAAVVSVAVAAGVALVPTAELLTPGDALLAFAVSPLIALFSLAVCRSRRTTALSVAAFVGWDAVALAVQDGIGPSYPVDVLLSAGVSALVAAAGRIRRRWVAERAAAARRLAEAEQARLEAADAERRRLARELHDVTAHHLTSIVVNASAAQFLGDQRPQLRAEALAFAARTGRAALADLRRLVAVLPSDAPAFAAAAPPPDLADLADDFRQLGQVVTVEIAGEPPPAVAEAMHAIAREALTNTLRYAPGGTVTLRFSYGPAGAELVIEDDGGDASAAATTAGLGGGRGLAGMRERAEALGGRLEAGPRTDRGWLVRATLPGDRPAARRAGRILRRLRSQAVLDAGLVLLTLALPLSGAAVAVEEDGATPAAATLIVLAMTAHAAPLLWRRWHPWLVLAAVAGTAWLGPLLVAARVTPVDGGWLFLFGFGAEAAAVYAVAARGRRPGLTWLAPLAAAANAALTLAVLLYAEPPPDPQPQDAAVITLFAVLLVAALVAGLLALPLGASWLAGHLTRRHRERQVRREEAAVAHAAAQAELRARDERARVAAGLRAAVLEHAARVPEAAERADLAGVVDSAKRSLSAMRTLLDGLGERPRQANAPEVASSPCG